MAAMLSSLLIFSSSTWSRSVATQKTAVMNDANTTKPAMASSNELALSGAIIFYRTFKTTHACDALGVTPG